MSIAAQNAPTDAAERRTSRRVRFKQAPEASAVIDGARFDCRIVDLSATGAKIKFDAAPHHPNARIEIGHDDLGVLAGDCVWQSGGYVGVRFETPLLG